MKVTSSLRDEAQRQATTEVVMGEVRRLGVQGGGMVQTAGHGRAHGRFCSSAGVRLREPGRDPGRSEP